MFPFIEKWGFQWDRMINFSQKYRVVILLKVRVHLLLALVLLD
jgi:low affinity Fe/Cu permease